jgi:hypothetical protein
MSDDTSDDGEPLGADPSATGEPTDETGDPGTAVATTAVPSTYKVRGRLDDPGGTGVFGYATATSGAGRGVTGRVDSPTDGAAGVLGEARGGSGATFGVRGVTDSVAFDATGVTAAGLYGEGTNADGVRGESVNGNGVVGASDGFVAVRALARSERLNAGTAPGVSVGVLAQSNAPGGEGVQAVTVNDAASGEAVGVRGRARSPGDAAAGFYPTGVVGQTEVASGTSLGVRGEVATTGGPGVVGLSTTDGYSFSYSATDATGVTGITDKSTDAAGVDFAAGVEGKSIANTGTAHGVYGSTDASGYGVYSDGDAKVAGQAEVSEVGASVYRSGSRQSVSGETTVAFQSERYDDRGEFDAAGSDAFTPDVGGTYHVESQVTWVGVDSATEQYHEVVVNGTTRAQAFAVGQGTTLVSKVIRVAAGDDVTIVVDQTGGSGVEVQPGEAETYATFTRMG